MLIKTIGKEELLLIKEKFEYTSIKEIFEYTSLSNREITFEATQYKTIYLSHTYEYRRFNYSDILPKIILVDNLNIALLKEIFTLIDSVFRVTSDLTMYIYFNSDEE